MKNIFTIVASKVVGLSLTSLMFYGHYQSVDWALNVSNVYFWILVIASFVVAMLTLFGSCMVSEKEKAKQVMENISVGSFRRLIGVIHSVLNVTVMSIAGFIWLPIFYTAVVCFVILLNSLSVSILKEKVNE